MLKNTRLQYGNVAKFFHWVIFLLVVCMFFIGYLMGNIQNKAVFAQVINIHKLTGLLILTLMILRLLWALVNPKPVLPFGTPAWQRISARSVHFLLYALLIAMPLSGWIMATAAGHPPKLLGWMFVFPVNKSKAIDEVFFNIHNTLAIVIIVFVSLHVLAALYHLLIRKDDVLQRMLPGD